MSENLQQTLEEIAVKVSFISPEVVATLPKSGQALLLSFLDEACLAEDIRRRNSLFCSEVVNVRSGKNLDDQDENVLALWMIGTLLSELFDEHKALDHRWFIAQKEKILDLFEKEPFFAKPVVVSESVVETVVETVVLPPMDAPPEKPVVPEPVVVHEAPTETPVVPPVVLPPVKESITVRLQKVRAEISEKAKSIDIQKLASLLTEKVNALHLKENISEKMAKMKGWFHKK